nr:DNA polymerase [Oceanisphaera litoralis]
MPFPLNYHKAHTGRWSGSEACNVQNLPRGSKHRLSLEAPPGYQVVVRDLSNIELRMNLWFCEQDDLLEEVGRGGDLYCAMGEAIYGYPVNKKENPDERQVGKVAALGLGFQMGWATFQATMAGGPMGMPPTFFPDSFCRQTKSAYDQLHPMIKNMWHFLGSVVIPAMTDELCDMEVGRHGCIKVRYQRLILPSGRELQYPGLHCQMVEHARGVDYEYRYDDGTRDRFQKVVWKKLYGGACLENAIQALARDVVAEHMVKTEHLLQANGTGWVVGSVHDEILSIVRDDAAQAEYDAMGTIMATPPAWCFDIPLASEGGFDTCYSK